MTRLLKLTEATSLELSIWINPHHIVLLRSVLQGSQTQIVLAYGGAVLVSESAAIVADMVREATA